MPRHTHVRSARYGGLLNVSRRHLAVTAALFVGSMATINSIPADAVQPTDAQYSAALQTLAVPAEVVEPPVVRDGFALSYFTVVGWPLAGGVAMSADFGPRNAPCAACSSQHQGIDWTPGAGTPIHAVTDGVVVEASSGGPFGVHAKIEHVIDGVKYYSLSAHMQTGSLAVAVGDTVTVGQQLGTVGSTGVSTGAHLHFEIHDAAGTPIDPYGWLSARVNG
ncbi:M23 family metallopeptidase [Salinibacterium sp. ZJ450]|uniref:M23 family metallopeptidase n=1 Tax=Salinibacterium sp. ZJ450 TaxID=2708338 RepID=UPI00141D9996|nr:M23 family metallopeptidase [Salinibacterium sp. ZJ450]